MRSADGVAHEPLIHDSRTARSPRFAMADATGSVTWTGTAACGRTPANPPDAAIPRRQRLGSLSLAVGAPSRHRNLGQAGSAREGGKARQPGPSSKLGHGGNVATVRTSRLFVALDARPIMQAGDQRRREDIDDVPEDSDQDRSRDRPLWPAVRLHRTRAAQRQDDVRGPRRKLFGAGQAVYITRAAVVAERLADLPDAGRSVGRCVGRLCHRRSEQVVWSGRGLAWRQHPDPRPRSRGSARPEARAWGLRDARRGP
jgi:hypothetical protein